jgi:microcystin-dependent protein
MTDNYLGEIRVFGFNYAPEGWHLCDGSLLTIQQNQALYALIGIAFGGDGKTTFAVPDLRGRTMIDSGQKPGGTAYLRGAKGGSETVTLVLEQTPPHIHEMEVDNTAGTVGIPANILAIPTTSTGVQLNAYREFATTNTKTTLNPATVEPAGSNAGHNNMQPFLTVNFCIATTGFFPPRPD